MIHLNLESSIGACVTDGIRLGTANGIERCVSRRGIVANRNGNVYQHTVSKLLKVKIVEYEEIVAVIHYADTQRVVCGSTAHRSTTLIDRHTSRQLQAELQYGCRRRL